MGSFNPTLCFVNASIILNTSRKEPHPNSNHSVCNCHLLEKNKKRTRTLCSSCVTGSHTGRQKSASNPCISSFSYECRELPFPCPVKWGGTAALTSLTQSKLSRTALEAHHRQPFFGYTLCFFQPAAVISLYCKLFLLILLLTACFKEEMLQ